MSIFYNLSIRNKLIGIILFVTILTLGIAFTLVIVSNIKTFKEDMKNNTIVTAQVIGEYCISPLVFKDKLIGILNLGAKRDGSSYSNEDEDAFLTLESQISIAINNAILFKVQKETQVLLAQKNKMDAIIALSSGINHEINNPLSIISMRCQNFLRKLSAGKFAGASEDFNPIHYDKDKAAADGLPGTIVHGRLKNAFLIQVLTDWIGDEGFLKKIAIQHRGMDLPGSPIACKGTVTKKYTENGENLVDCEVWTENAKGEKTAPATATVSLPSKG